MIGWESLRIWLALLQIAQIVVTAGVGVVAWRLSRDRARRAEIEAMETDIDAVRVRMQDIEANLRHMPTQSDLRLLSDRLEQMHGDLRELSGSFRGLSRAVDLMNSHLLDQQRGRGET